MHAVYIEQIFRIDKAKNRSNMRILQDFLPMYIQIFANRNLIASSPLRLIALGQKEKGGEALSRIGKLFKKGLAITFAALMTMSLMSFSAAAATDRKYNFPDGAADVSVSLDGKEVLLGESVIINSVTYVPLRSVAELLGADSIEWNQKTQIATVKKGSLSVKVKNYGNYIEAAGRYFYTYEPVRNIDNRIFVPIRPIAALFCLDLYWNGGARVVELTTTGKSLEGAQGYYDADDLYWLSRIISAEAAGESLFGQIAVGNVVLNRVRSKQYPNTVYGVIFDRVGGVQFSPVAMGTIYKTPTESSVVAAKICLEGYSVSENILFFMNPRIATNNWISKNRPYAFSIGNHDFYY